MYTTIAGVLDLRAIAISVEIGLDKTSDSAPA